MTGISKLCVDGFLVANKLPLQISLVANATPTEFEDIAGSSKESHTFQLDWMPK